MAKQGLSLLGTNSGFLAYEKTPAGNARTTGYAAFNNDMGIDNYLLLLGLRAVILKKC